MAEFQLSPEDLIGLVSGFTSLLADLDSATGQVKSGNAGAAGRADLEAALSDVMGRMSSGIDQIHGSLRQLQQRLGGAAGAYENTDASVSQSFGG